MTWKEFPLVRFMRPGHRRLWLVYSLVSLAVVLPFFKPGFILTLDMVFTPKLQMPDSLNNGYLFYTLLHALNWIISAEIIQKALLFAIFLLAGYGLHRLLLALNLFEKDKYPAGYYVGGIFYAINPFTYDRLMAGQYGVLLGYALLPFFARTLLAFVGQPDTKQAIYLALWAALICTMSIHAVGYIAVLSLIGIGLALWKRRSGRYTLDLLRALAVAAGVFILASCYWLVPLALGKGSTATQIAQFSNSDTAAFATAGQNVIEQIANLIRLQGFWLEERGLYILPQANISAWGLLALMLWVVVAVGLIWAWKHGQRFIAAFCCLLIVAGIILATGLWQQPGQAAFLRGFREPQKFAALITLGYGLGLGIGAQVILKTAARTAGKPFRRLALATLLLIPLIFTSTLLWGCRGQLVSRQYPASWYEVHELLKRQGAGQAIFLPWHLYMHYGFAGRIIASPAPAFFDTSMLVSDDPEFAGAGAANTSPAKRAAARLFTGNNSRKDLAAQLAGQRIGYILLAREDDYQNYDYLKHTPGLQRVYQSRELDVYRNTAYQETTK